MGHSFLYATNFMYSRNAFFYKVPTTSRYAFLVSLTEKWPLLALAWGQLMSFSSVCWTDNFLSKRPNCHHPFQVTLFTELGMAFQALSEAPYSVDTFFFIGATLVSYLLLKVTIAMLMSMTMTFIMISPQDLDKTNGWLNKKGFVHMVFFYFNRS